MLPGEVYVRASLRTYASYLGLDADKVATPRSHGGGGRAGAALRPSSDASSG